MIKISILYPNSKDAKFDIEYYKNKHLPMISKDLGTALKSMELDLGISGRKEGEAAPYVAIVHLTFDDAASFKSSFGPHAEKFTADVKNFTTIKSIFQMSEIIKF